MIKTKSISYKYEGQKAISFPNIAIDQGKHTLILGDSGCGKTTLLQVLAGLRKPTTGSVVIQDVDIVKLGAEKLDKFRGEHIGIIFQTPHFIRALTVEENLKMAQQLSGRSIDDSTVANILTQLNIKDKANKKTQALSVGEQQRVAIARALINSPRVIFADEPTSALDDFNTDRVIDLLKSQAEQSGATLLVVTHDKRLKDNFSNRVEL